LGRSLGFWGFAAIVACSSFQLRARSVGQIVEAFFTLRSTHRQKIPGISLEQRQNAEELRSGPRRSGTGKPILSGPFLKA